MRNTVNIRYFNTIIVDELIAGIILIIISIRNSFFKSTVIQFGTDQMIEASSN